MSNDPSALLKPGAPAPSPPPLTPHLTSGESWPNIFSHWYTNKIISRGNTRPYEYSDLYTLDDDFITSIGFPKFLKHWQDKKDTQSLPRIVISYRG